MANDTFDHSNMLLSNKSLNPDFQQFKPIASDSGSDESVKRSDVVKKFKVEIKEEDYNFNEIKITELGKETVKKSNAATDRIAVGKRCAGDIGVGFGINTSSEIKRSVSATRNTRGKSAEDRITPGDLCIAVVGCLDLQLGGMRDGEGHAVF